MILILELSGYKGTDLIWALTCFWFISKYNFDTKLHTGDFVFFSSYEIIAIPAQRKNLIWKL